MRTKVFLASALACAITAALPAAGRSDATLTAPPAGIVATHTSLAHVLHAWRASYGTHSSNPRREHWTTLRGKVAGTRDELFRGDDFRIDQTRGTFHTAYGSFNGHAWDMNENGQVITESGLHQRTNRDDAALRRAGPGVTLLGTVANPLGAYVVRVAPPKGRLEYVFFDPKTGAMVRIESVRDGHRTVTTFDDLRTERGTTRAWHFTYDDGRKGNLFTAQLVSLDTTTPMSDTVLAIPSDTRALISLPPGSTVSLPAEIIGDRVILPFRIDGRVVDFQLDSGASGILIDRAIVKALKIKRYGKRTGETAGEYVESDVVLPKLSIGSVTLRNVSATSVPFLNFANAKTPVAGLMGFDFIESTVVHIDYRNGTLALIDPSTFVPPAGAIALPIALDDYVPVVRSTIGSASNLPFILDTGADRSTLFPLFARRHPHQARDRGLGTSLRAEFPFVDELHGVGGEVAYTPLQVGPFTLAKWSFPTWLFYLTQNAPAFAGEDYNGLIGQDVLRYFDVYLDYRHQLIYLKPNQRYADRFE